LLRDYVSGLLIEPIPAALLEDGVLSDAQELLIDTGGVDALLEACRTDRALSAALGTLIVHFQEELQKDPAFFLDAGETALLGAAISRREGERGLPVFSKNVLADVAEMTFSACSAMLDGFVDYPQITLDRWQLGALAIVLAASRHEWRG
jgi:hypothetical protein